MTGYLRRIRRPGPLVAISLVYFLAASGLMIWRGISVSPDYIVLLLIPVGLLSGRFLGYLKDWVPFIAILLGWEAMRGIAPNLGMTVHMADLAGLERTIFFGRYPNEILQSSITGDARSTISFIATVVYFLHFVAPLGIGMVLWLVDRTQFLRFTTALMGMAFFCFVIYLLAPTAPPWYAEDHGVINGVERLINLPSAVSPYYNSLNANPVAAFPSLHAAFPFIGLLAMRRVYPRASWLALGWCVIVWFSVIFLGEHWCIDVIAGVITAAASWWVTMHVLVPRFRSLQTDPPSPDDAAAATVTGRTGAIA